MASVEYRWQVPVDHPAYAGHFPGQPIVPGVVLLDQAILFAEKMLACPAGNWQVGNAKFLSPVVPGEVLTFDLNKKPSGAIAFAVHCEGRLVSSGSLTPPAVA
jgi:3-hydroxyacyl-[acyl-carrier-protein] dehydratase